MTTSSGSSSSESGSTCSSTIRASSASVRYPARVANPSGGNSEYLMGRKNGLCASVSDGRMSLTRMPQTTLNYKVQQPSSRPPTVTSALRTPLPRPRVRHQDAQHRALAEGAANMADLVGEDRWVSRRWAHRRCLSGIGELASACGLQPAGRHILEDASHLIGVEPGSVAAHIHDDPRRPS